MAADLLEHALDVLAEKKVATDDLRHLANDLAGALRATLRVSVNRGSRLSLPEPSLRTEIKEHPNRQLTAEYTRIEDN
ncbi:hypothetical protein [Streptomyces sp. GF20]|uniref:hypothetical protein n=1 Tax=Streptomyces sp. GF20 TaxID=2692235 RepID=UPI002E2B5FFA|nr:hypothetical protein [Streptomyces sp. GF20]